MARVNTDSKLWQAAYEHKNRAIKVKQKPYKKIEKPPHKEPMELQNELAEVNRQIKELLQRKKHLHRTLSKMGQKQIRGSYFEKPIILYALELEDGCYYVGMTRNIDVRFKKHVKGKGSKWTKEHYPLRIIETRETKLTDDSEACRLEDEMTLEYARRYGMDVVRGGGYCQKKPRWPADLLEPDLSWIK